MFIVCWCGVETSAGTGVKAGTDCAAVRAHSHFFLLLLLPGVTAESESHSVPMSMA